MAIDKQLYTLDEYHAFIDLPENRDRIFELIDGEVIEKDADTSTAYLLKVNFPREFVPSGLVIEVKSSTDSKRAMRRKAERYLALGTRIVWLVFPDEQYIEVYLPDEDVKTVGIDGTLDGGDVLPGFTLSIAEIFLSK